MITVEALRFCDDYKIALVVLDWMHGLMSVTLPEPIASLSIPIDDARRLCAEGLVAFARGDIAAARAYLKRAAEGGDARALMALGDTYDPTTLTRLGAVGLKGDEATARNYYSRALAAGVAGSPPWL